MITVRMSKDRVGRVDALVASGVYSTRADLVRAAVDELLRREEEAAIDRAIVEGYTRIPSTPEEDAWAEWSARESVREEPW
ncbi:MAG TPA: ribbon-helix-helix domain-containing protein [Gaiellaceae bacterium]|nr:ribbon-helix-helix domain-containing protein [Gaiellaceae bacterium]